MLGLLHIHGDIHHDDNLIHAFLGSVLFDAFLETLIIIPFLFLAYLVMEFIEHKATDKTLALLKRGGKAGPLFGSLFGAVPQCAFSAVASNFYTGRVITLGTLFAVFLSTSDEMLFIMISEGVSATEILTFLAYKVLVGIVVGFVIDAIIRFIAKPKSDAKCEGDFTCNDCHSGILPCAIRHTVKISVFIFAVTLLINTLVFFVGTDNVAIIISKIPVLSHLISAFVGLIPGCATSVALTSLYTSGMISGGVMLSGLFSGAGVGALVLLRVNKNMKENLAIMGALAFVGFLFGLLFDITGIAALIS